MRRCPTTTRWPLFGYMLLPAYGSSTDVSASLTWRNSGSVNISSFEQHDVAARPNTADADNLSSDVHGGVLLEQVLAIGIQAFQVLIEGIRETASDILADHLGWHALNQRRVIHNPAPPVLDRWSVSPALACSYCCAPS